MVAGPERTVVCPVLVERGREVSTLDARVDRLGPAGGGVVLLAGPAGVGKSRLAREAVGRARARGLAVLTGRSAPGATAVPFRPLTEALLGAFRSGAPVGSELTGFHGQVGRLVPAWRGDLAGGADESPVLLGEAVVRLLQVAAAPAGGAVLLLEDLHWADPETLAAVDHLAGALVDQPVLCVATTRFEGDVVEHVSRWRREPGVTTIGVSALTPEGVHDVVAACLGTDDLPPPVVSLVAASSDGNPFLIEELLGGLVSSGALHTDSDGRWAVAAGRLGPPVPFDFAASVRTRLATLDATSRRVVGAAALLGRRFDWELLPGVAEVDGRAVVDGLRAAVDEQLVDVDGDEFTFRHALTREAVLAELLPPERRDLAGRAGPAIERAHPGLPGHWCEQAADLAELAGRSEAAAAHLAESARRVLRGGALATAEANARRGQALAPPGTDVADEVDEVLVEVLALGGKPAEAAAVGVPLVDRLDGERRVDVLLVLARAALAGGDPEGADALVARARGAHDGTDTSAARIEAVAAHVSLQLGRREDAAGRAGAALRLGAATGQPEIQCDALVVLGRTGADEEAIRVGFERSAALAEEHGLVTWQVRARHELDLQTSYRTGDLGPLRRTRALAASQGALITVAAMDLALAEIGLTLMDGPGCVGDARRCVAASRRYGLASLPVAHLWLAGGCALTGDADGLAAAAAAALEPDPDDPRILGDLWGRVHATDAMVRVDRTAWRACLDRQMDFVRIAPTTTSMFPNRMAWGFHRCAEDDDLGAPARAELAAATHMRHWPVFVHFLAAMDAVVACRSGEANGTTALAAAVDTLLAVPVARPTLLFCLLLVAERAHAEGWGDPAGWLRHGHALFGQTGHEELARACRASLAAIGAPVPRQRGEVAVPAELRALGVTGRELEVLQLVAEGLTNRAIAERLFLSPKTVERHLSSLFARTGLRSRHELGALLD